ncbi:MAG: hypothetical protein U0946_02910, partial [Patescibacteria group bacterium]|nr:hypothetical protein [Patescibacteria group bacterium]
MFLLFELLIIKNPSSIKAAVTCDGSSADINTNCENKDVIIDGGAVAVIVSGKHKFKNLTIKNGGELTHDAVLTSEIANPAADPLSLDLGVYLSAAALEKKVDLEVEGSVILESGGKIDVSGKGYPGNNWADGFGPGKGRYTGGEYGGGAGFGGVGGGGGWAGGVYPSNFISGYFEPSQFYFGSAGGGALADCGDPARTLGGAGGGRIYIKAGKIVVNSGSSIVANGDKGGVADSVARDIFGSVVCRRSARGGGGSGGLVWLEATSFAFTASADVTTYNGGANGGSIGTYNYDLTTYGLHVNGNGERAADGTNGGGGGRIVVKKNESRFIRKTLQPIERGGSVNTNFNPYAVEAGDIIQVNIIVSGLEANKTYDIKDNILKLPNGSKKCVPVEGTFTDPDPLNFTGIYNDVYHIVVWDNF